MAMINSSSEIIIDQRYRLEELLGEGGSGSTYRATRLIDGTVVAIKILSLQHLNDWKQLELFEREAQILSQLDHPQIPQYLEYFHVDTPTDRAFYIVQQLAPGQPLNALVQSGWRGTLAEIRAIAQQLLEILQYLQAQSPPLIHRDIKPHNIIRNVDGRVFLVDFGAVQATYHNTLLKGNTVAGTYGYMAPEQFRGRATVASDLYGLGATVLYLLTHRSPADLPQERLKISFRSHVQITESFADWLETMLEPDETDRFPSASKALSALVSNRYRRATTAQKIGFPWRAATVAAMVMAIAFPLAHQYRYAFLTLLGLQPNDLCSSIARGDLHILDNYLNHGGDINTKVSINGDRDYGDNITDHIDDTGSLLHCAVSANQVKIFQHLLQRGANTQRKDGMGRTILQRFISQYQECTDDSQGCTSIAHSMALLKLLVANGLDHDIHSEPPLLTAVTKHKATIVQQLITLGADPHMIDAQGQGLLHTLAAQDNYVSTPNQAAVQKIFNILLTYHVDLNRADNDGNRPLHIALSHHHQQMTNLLLQQKVDFSTTNKQGRTPLMTAIDKGNRPGISKLLSLGVQVNAQDAEGMTALHLLIQSNHWSGARRKDQSVDPTVEWANKAKVAQELLAHGANPNILNKKAWSLLHLLAATASKRVSDDHSNSCVATPVAVNPLFVLLVKQVANPQAINGDGNSALHQVANSPILVQQLVAMGWDPNQKNRQGQNTLVLMTDRHYLTQEQLQLLETAVRGGNLNTQDAQGNTALHRILDVQGTADPDKLNKIIANLVTLGADLSIRNQRQETPLDIARHNATTLQSDQARQVQMHINQCKIESDLLHPRQSRKF
jgi:serine/threonine protein kinase/ankyrin repeat protein